MHPTHYDLYLEPDLNTFLCPGRVSIAITPDAPAEAVVLNANDLEIAVCTLRQDDAEVPCAFVLDAEAETLTVTLSAPQAAPFTLTVAFTAHLNDLLVGFYRSQYIQDGQTKYVAVTQFEERDARRAFPCFDEPGLKATFDITLTVDAALTALANTDVMEELPLSNGKTQVRFARTPRMSTYLLFFGVGDFEIIDDGQTDPRVRVITTPGKTQYGRFALDWGRKSLDFGAAYTGIPFPITKCDYIAVPDFAFGAMENYGAITFRENALLVYPGVTSQQQRVQIAEVIAHETAHMWFGDLVSPRAWKDIWLNESFATYFTTVIPDAYCPEWRLWEEFFTDTTLTGMERDALRGTVPIELPDGAAINIDSSSAPIIYSKGAAIIQMLAAYLGEEKLKRGVNHFLGKFRFGNANSADYWAAFEEATGEPVSEFAASWVYQPGYPLVTVRREGDTLRLSQERFIVSDPAGAPSAQRWIIPLEIAAYQADGSAQMLHAVLDAAEGALDLPAGTTAYQLNVGRRGFYRVKYPLADLAALGRLSAEGRLSAIDATGLESDLFALIRRGDYPVSVYLDFVQTAFARETRYLPLDNLAQDLFQLHLVVAGQRERVCAVGRPILENALLAMQLTPQPGDDLHTATLRNTLLWTAFTLGSEEAAAFGEAQFRAALAGEPVSADILGSVYRIGAVTHAEAAYPFFTRTLADPDAPEVQKLTALNALGRFLEPDKLRAALALNFAEVPRKNRFTIVGAMTQNPAAAEFLWEWLPAHLDDLQTMHPMHFGQALLYGLSICGVTHRAEVAALLADLAAAHPIQRDVLAMAGEMVEVYARMNGSR